MKVEGFAKAVDKTIGGYRKSEKPPSQPFASSFCRLLLQLGERRGKCTQQEAKTIGFG
jgi:hypothetical protein